MAASKWGEVRGDAHHAGMVGWGESWDRKVRTRTLFPVPETEVVETEDGLALKAAGPREETSEARGLLEEFASLDEADPTEIRNYARRFGFLQVCEHGLPYHHRPKPYPRPETVISPTTLDKLVERGATPSEVLDRAPLAYWCRPVDPEPLFIWRSFSRDLRALLGIAARLQRGKVGREKDWAVVYDRSGREAPWWDQGVEIDRIQLGRVVDEWLEMSGARPMVRWHTGDDRPTVEIGAHGLFQNLARDLALTVARLDGLALCAGCGEPYSPKRKPREDRRNFCAPCREEGVPARLRMRDRRQRQRGETDAPD